MGFGFCSGPVNFLSFVNILSVGGAMAKPKRDVLQITHDFLFCCSEEPALFSAISRVANLDTFAFQDYSRRLIERNLLKSFQFEGHTYFRATSFGLQFLRKYDELQKKYAELQAILTSEAS